MFVSEIDLSENIPNLLLMLKADTFRDFDDIGDGLVTDAGLFDVVHFVDFEYA